jgi:NAD-dependent SIR2 family protein deacetylase
MYISYEKERDCLFFLGAGASYSDGVPLQKDIIPMILYPETKEFESSELRRDVSNFLRNNFSCLPEKNIYPSLEVIFSYLDYFIVNDISLSSAYTINGLVEIKEELVKLIYYITSKPIKPQEKNSIEVTNSVYVNFWKRMRKTKRNFSIITTNYDNFIDNAFDGILYPKYGLIDYCVDFLNYTEEDIAFNWWINPRDDIPKLKDYDLRPIKLIKIHGSLNWKYCHCCSHAILTPWCNSIDLDTGILVRSVDMDHESISRCARDGHYLSTLMIPPSHNKILKHPVIQQLMNEAQEEIRKSKNVVFIGYSFPDSDIHIRALFKKNLNKNTNITVINPNLPDEQKNAYKGISDEISFIDKTFEEALDDGIFETFLKS